MGVAVKKEWIDEACAHGWRDDPQTVRPRSMRDMLRSMRDAIAPAKVAPSLKRAAASR